jgi:hypothetical protein
MRHDEVFGFYFDVLMHAGRRVLAEDVTCPVF